MNPATPPRPTAPAISGKLANPWVTSVVTIAMVMPIMP